MINYQQILVYDYETGSKYARTTDPLQLAAVTIDPRKLTVNEDDVFQVYLKPENNDWSKVETEALAVNHLSKEIIEEKGVDLKLGWGNFVKWVNKFNTKKTIWSAPVACGMNVKGFDRIITERMCDKFGPKDDIGQPTLFHPRDSVDLLDILFLCFENRSDLGRYNMDAVRDYLGISKEGSHDAVKDCIDTAKVVARFMNMFRNKLGKMQYKDAFKGD